jgi:hypothetical protein
MARCGFFCLHVAVVLLTRRVSEGIPRSRFGLVYELL